MSELGSIPFEIEKPREGQQDSNEWVGSTEVHGFEGCDLATNEQVASYLSETIPPSHLEGCPSISVDPANEIFAESPNTLGFYETGSHEIHLADESRFSNGREGLLETVTHEVGHNAYAATVEPNPEASRMWDELYAESLQKRNLDGMGFVSDYATTNKYEDFAESYRAYVRDPEKLQVMSPDKYEFMRDFVFGGREYQPGILGYWDYDSAGNKIEVTSSGVYDLQGNRIAWSL